MDIARDKPLTLNSIFFFHKHRGIVVCINHFWIMNQSCELSFLLVGAAAPQEVISPSRVKAVTHNLKTAVRLTIKHESVCPWVSWGAAGGWFSSSLWWFMPDTSWYSKESAYKKKEEVKKDAIHMFCISACMGEDDISFLTPSHLKRANSICTPSCF